MVAGSDFNFLTSGTVSNVDVQNVIGSGMVMGIFANRIEQSTVHTISQSLSLGTKNFYGMVGEFLDGCKATALRASSAGARALSGNSVRDCNVSNAINTPFGITGIISNVVENCTVYLINGDGITATSDRGRVTGCQVCETVGYTGIKFVASSGIIENNSVNKASSGIVTDDTAKVLVRGNTVFDCPTKYTFGAATRAGPIINTAGSIVSTSPFANFSD